MPILLLLLLYSTIRIRIDFIQIENTVWFLVDDSLIE